MRKLAPRLGAAGARGDDVDWLALGDALNGNVIASNAKQSSWGGGGGPQVWIASLVARDDDRHGAT